MKIVQSFLSSKEIVLDFENLINKYCEQIHLSENIPRFKICGIVVQEFKKDFSEDFIRRKVDSIYKVSHKSNNAKKKGKSLLEKLKEKASLLDEEIKTISQESVTYVGK